MTNDGPCKCVRCMVLAREVEYLKREIEELKGSSISTFYLTDSDQLQENIRKKAVENGDRI